MPPQLTFLLFVKVATAYSGDSPNRTIQMLNVADGNYKPLTTRTQLEAYPTFSPDGSKIVWTDRIAAPDFLNPKKQAGYKD